MATVTIDTQVKQIKDNIKNKNLSPIYLIKGEESYYIDLICAEFEKKLIDEDAKDFNQTVVYGKDATANQLVSLCRQYPLMSDLKLVILKEAQLMDKKEWTNFLVYLANPQPTTILVICNKAKTFDIKSKNAIVKSGGIVIESEKIKDNKLPTWISSYIKSKKYTIDEKSINMLCEFLGNNLQKISNELNKLILNIKDKTNITSEDIVQFIGKSKEYNIFELQKALGVKNIMKVNEIINYFEKNPKENPIQLIIPMLFTFYTKLLIASQVPSRSSADIASALGFNSPYFASDYVTALRYYNENQLLSIVSLFNEYDLKSKGIGASPLMTDVNLLKELVYKIMHI